MKTFLQIVAEDIYKKVGNDLENTAIVFPNKRARLFFNEHLASESNQPIWSPAYISISELFQQLSPYKLGDPIQLVCEVYKVFCQASDKAETLDDFYFWGELLISDFDDVDKNLVNADKLFSNLRELKEMDDFSFLTDEQVAIIKQFFKHFDIDKETELKRRFISLWNKLGEVYTNYRQRLHTLGIAYEGMMYREVIEHLQADALPYNRYIFVGFNVLNEVEKTLFKQLQAAGKAMFYWDYDTFYTQPAQASLPYIHEAGEFILRNMALFPNELPPELFDQLRQEKQIRYIASPTENGQARYLPQWIREVVGSNNNNLKENAVVLCNEALLLPILHSIPEEVKHANITMGFPLSQTPTYSFVCRLLELQLNGYRQHNRYEFRYVVNLLRHPFTRQLSPHAEALEKELTKKNRFYPTIDELQADEWLSKLFTPHTDALSLCQYLSEMLCKASTIYRAVPTEDDEEDETSVNEDVFSQLYQESLYKGYKLVNRILLLLQRGELEAISNDTLQRLLTRLMTAETIPFHGEPAIGMQIMGVLETRNLDFKNLIMLSLNEGKLPKKERESSFIPYNLRKGFGMTTIEHKNSVYAYYFYRLIQRAQNITLIYNTSSDGLNRGEMSRFMLQLLAEWPHAIQNYHLEAGQQAEQINCISIAKSEEMIRLLHQRYNALDADNWQVLSPSALNTYLECPLRFYFRYVAGLKVADEVSAEIDSKLFGTIFHRSAELIYKQLTEHGKEVRKADIEELLKNEAKIRQYVDDAFKEELFQIKKHEKTTYNGQQLINSQVIVYYLKQLLRNDLQYTPFTLEGMETRVNEDFTLNSAIGPITIRLGGTIDRMDKQGDTLRVLDYKTGGKPKDFKEMSDLFTPKKDRPSYVFQTFLYSAIMCRKQSSQIAPALLYIHQAADKAYSPIIGIGTGKDKIAITNFAPLEDDFRARLQTLLEEIFNTDTPFYQTIIPDNCKYCDFKRLCKRNGKE